jgi:ATP-dependent Clp protease ATP-binding subunit ClpC
LQEELSHWKNEHADLDLLSSIGTIWTSVPDTASRTTVDHPDLQSVVSRLEALLFAEQPRSVVLFGESGVGKSVIVRTLGRRLQERGWLIFQAGHAELVAGKSYFGEFEEQLRNLIRQLRGKTRILWVVPEFHALAEAGRHRHGPISALDTILPLVEQGEITVLGECDLGAFERLVQSKPRCRTAFAAVRVNPLGRAQAIDLARRWLRLHLPEPTDEKTLEVLVEEASHLAQQFLGIKAAPGNLLELLGLTWQRLAAGELGRRVRILPDDLIVTVSQITGLPAQILDDRVSLDLGGLRDLFHSRVISQPEAVDCLVERMAMIKAGVTDPTRPYGVFLFAGPTGTGKTEIAKTLAEFLFGSPDRLVRLDMSELQLPESLDRVLGTSDPEMESALVDQVRRQPFSVVLLDEFEKANERVWDLFLQVFDDGRLTGRRGATADFRHAIIILTSNLGGTIASGVLTGFSGTAEGFRPGNVTRAISRAFRAEFLNRLDRVVVFKPLGREAMRAILRKELDDAFGRRGLRSRSWAVEYDESAVQFLLDRGFASNLGARPLKRAVERFLLTPLALAIVNREAPSGDQFLFVTAQDQGLKVEFVDPDRAEESARDSTETPVRAPRGEIRLERLALQPRGVPEEIQFLASRLEHFRRLVEGESWRESKSKAIGMTDLADFWSSPDRFDVLGRYEYQDRVESALQRAQSLFHRLSRQDPAARDRLPAHLVGKLAQTLYLLQAACEDVERNRPREAFLSVEARRSDTERAEGDASAFGPLLARMYRSWAERRRMRFQVLQESPATASRPFRFLVAVGGFRAYSILEPEGGLHVLETPDGRGRSFERTTAQVRVVAQSPAPPPDKLEALRAQAERSLQETERETRVVRRYPREPSPLVRDSVRGWRTGRLDLVLNGDFNLIIDTADDANVAKPA